MEILVDDEIINKLEDIAVEENKSSQEIVSDLIENFVEEKGL